MPYSLYCQQIKEAVNKLFYDYEKELYKSDLYDSTTLVEVMYNEYFDFRKFKSELSKYYLIISDNNLDDLFYLKYMGLTFKCEYKISNRSHCLEISFIKIDEDEYLRSVSMSEVLD